jgi:4-amino-4-deoxy-L-arabinose transferase-like glycosyltransferase
MTTPGDSNIVDAPWSIRARWLYPSIAAALIAAFLVQAWISVTYSSLTYDEPVYISSGYSYWATRDDRMNLEHPPLMKMWIALPLLPLRLTVPTRGRTWQHGDEGDFAPLFLSMQRGVERIVLLSRLSIVLLAVVLALFVRRWAADLWGPEAGLAALLLFVFEPNIVANSTLATLDIGLTAFLFIAMFYLWRWLNTGRRVYAIPASVALGFALLSKEAALAFLPAVMGPLVAVPAPDGGRMVPRLKIAVQLLLGAAAVVVLVYATAFHWRPLVHPGGQHRTVDRVLARVPRRIQNQVISVGQAIMIPDAAAYVRVLLAQREHLAIGHPMLVMGRLSVRGRWSDYVVAFLLKTPLPILFLIATRLALLPVMPMTAADYLMLLPVGGILLVASFESRLAYLGLRMILPLYPFLLVWLSGFVVRLLAGAGRPATRQPAAPVPAGR